MRLLFIVHRFPPNFLGGADIYTYSIAKELHRRGHDVAVLCAEDIHDPSTGLDEVKALDDAYDGLPVRRLYFNWQRMSDPHGALWIVNPAIAQAADNYLRQWQPDLVHITSCYMLSAGVITAAKQLNLPVFLTLTGKWFVCPVGTLLRWDSTLCTGRQDGLTCLRCQFGPTGVYQALSRLPERVSRGLIRATGRSVTLSRSVNSLNVAHAVERRNTVLPAILSEVDYIISPSECHRQVFDRSRIIGIEEIHYLAHGHNVERAAQGQEKVPSDKLRFGFTGNPSPHKGVRTLIEAWQKLKSPLNAELHIWGDLDSKGAFGQALKEMARNDPSIIFQGPFEHKDIGRILQSIDVVVVPSECIENSPLTIAEAFAAQTPVLGSDTCGVVEHIQPEIDGLLFKRGDASALARQMKRLIAEPDLLSKFMSGIKPVRTIAEEADELVLTYSEFVGKAQDTPARVIDPVLTE